MPDVYISVGSNVEPQAHLRAAAVALADRYGLLRLSPVYRNAAIGFDGDDFYNFVIAFETDEPIAGVVTKLADIEAAHGRRRGEEKFGPRTLDLDLLLYGDEVAEVGSTRIPREEINHHDFVLKPLLDLAPALTHPATGQPLAEIWADLERDPARLQPVSLSWA